MKHLIVRIKTTAHHRTSAAWLEPLPYPAEWAVWSGQGTLAVGWATSGVNSHKGRLPLLINMRRQTKAVILDAAINYEQTGKGTYATKL